MHAKYCVYVIVAFHNISLCPAFSAHILSPVFHHTVSLEVIAVVGERRTTMLIVVQIALKVWKLLFVQRKKELSPNVFNILESVKCSTCSSQFADEATLATLMSKVSFCLYHLLLIRALLLVA